MNKINEFYKVYSCGISILQRIIYEYHKLNNLKNMKISNKSSVKKGEDATILRE